MIAFSIFLQSYWPRASIGEHQFENLIESAEIASGVGVGVGSDLFEINQLKSELKYYRMFINVILESFDVLIFKEIQNLKI